MIMRIVCVIIGYICGLFQTSYIYGRMHGIDIREHGSGNAGTTNMLRTLGRKAGLITLLGDALKTIIAVLICLAIFYRRDVNPEELQIIKLYASAGAILGHDFPFYLNFKGGKGIACTAGMIIALDPYMTLIDTIIFFTVFFITHYVSLSSISIYVAFFIETVIMSALCLGHFGNITFPLGIECDILAFLLCALAIFGHRENIKRLLSHTERKTYLTHKKGEDK